VSRHVPRHARFWVLWSGGFSGCRHCGLFGQQYEEDIVVEGGAEVVIE